MTQNTWKTICEYCQKPIIRNYSHGAKFHSKMKGDDEDCGEIVRTKIEVDRRLNRKIDIKCFRCGHAWPRRVAKPAVCPKCKSPDYETPRKLFEEERDVLCQSCGAYKSAKKVVCSSCRLPNTEKTHRFGITLGNWNKMLAFLHAYAGGDDDIVKIGNEILNYADPIKHYQNKVKIPHRLQVTPSVGESIVEEVEFSPEEALAILVEETTITEDTTREEAAWAKTLKEGGVEDDLNVIPEPGEFFKDIIEEAKGGAKDPTDDV